LFQRWVSEALGCEDAGDKKIMVQQEYGPGGVQEHMLEELQLYCVYKPGHQGWRKWLLALVQ
jgi:hypothetical protein